MGPDVGAASRMGHEGFAARTPLLSPCSEKGLGLWGGREGRRSRMPCRAVLCRAADVLQQAWGLQLHPELPPHAWHV